MKKHLLFFVATIVCLLFATLGVSASADVDNIKYIPKVITTDNGYKMMFDSELARIARRMSSDSYGIAINSNAQDIAKTFKEEGFEDIKQSHLFDEPFMGVFSNNFLVGVKTFEVDGVQKHVLAIAFRGTQVKDVFDYADLFTDISILGVNGFHSGFYAAALKAYDTLYDMEFPSLKNEDGSNMTFSDYLAHSGVVGSDYSILVTGHSLGGAVANIFVGDIISKTGKSNVMCYTFASPIVCSPTKAEEYDSYNIFNIINTNDVVPNVGYNLFSGVRLGTDLKVAVTDSEESAHNLSVTYEKATNSVIDARCTDIHRKRIITTVNGIESVRDEIYIHTACILEKRRFPQYIGESTLFICENVNLKTDIKMKGSLVLYDGAELQIGTARVEVGGFRYGGILKMSDSEGYLLVNGNFEQYGNYTADLTAGVCEIKGDMIYCGDYKSSGTHKTILSGEKGQKIDLYDYSTGYFNILEVTNTSNEGVEFISSTYAYGQISSDFNTKIINGEALGIKGSSWINKQWMGSLSASDWTSENECIINGDLVISGEIKINADMKVNGNLTLSSDRTNLQIGAARVEIGGDFKYRGSLTMSDAEGYLLINGNFKNMAGYTAALTAGVCEIKGDMIECSIYWSVGNHKTILSGEKSQKIDLYNYNTGRFNILEVTNTSNEGVEFTSEADAYGQISSDINAKIINGHNLEIKGNSPINKQWMGSLSASNWTSEKECIINGDLVISGENKINADMKVNGNLTIPSDRTNLQIGAARVEIGGDFKHYGPLTMSDAEGYLLINGNFKYMGGYIGNVTAGVCEIKGDMIDAYSYQASGTHKTILSGEKGQKVCLSYNGKIGRFNILEVTNTSDEGVVFEDTINVLEDIFQPIGTKLTGSSYVKLQDKTAFVDYGELNLQINAFNGNDENAIPTWIDYNRYIKMIGNNKAFTLNESITDTAFTCDLYFSNDYSKSSAVVIVAFYDGDNRFVQMAWKPVDVKAGKIDCSIEFEDKDYSKCKVMIWESFENLTPLSSVFEF